MRQLNPLPVALPAGDRPCRHGATPRRSPAVRVPRWKGGALGLALAGSLVQAQSTERVSLDSSAGQADNSSTMTAVSAEGRFVAFVSSASNLVPGDTNGVTDVFVRDRLLGTTERMSVSSAGVQANLSSSDSYRPAISADGRFVAFDSWASNLVTADTNGVADVFVHDRQTGTTECVSVNSAGVQAQSMCYGPSLSADGRFVVFESMSSNLSVGDVNGMSDIFLHDRQTGVTELVSLGAGGVQGNDMSHSGSVTADGRFVVFDTFSSNLVAGDTNSWGDVFLRDRQNGTSVRVSVSTTGVQGSNWSLSASITPDGRFVVFHSWSSNLVAGDTNVAGDIFVRDLLAGTTERVSLDSAGAQGNAESGSYPPSISAGGRFVAFESLSTNLVAGDTNACGDVFVHDRLSGTTERVSVDSGGTQAQASSLWPAISADGRFVAFESSATNLVVGDTNGFADIFAHDRGAPPPAAFCFGDGSAGACPCGNYGIAGRGCENSASTGGALLSSAGAASLASDTLVLTSAGELPSVSSILLQGDASVLPLNFGDGLRCVGGSLKRLYLHSASGGSVSAPQPGDLSISARSAALGDVIPVGATRSYQIYYRDPAPTFCPTPQGNGWNVSSGLSITWAQ